MFYGPGMARMLKFRLAELLFGDIGVEIPTYVRNDNSTASYQVDSPNTVTRENALMAFWEAIGWIIEKQLAERGYIPGGLDTSDGLTKAMSSSSLRSLSDGNSYRIVTEIQKDEIRRKLPASKHYIFPMKQFRVKRI